MAFALNETNGSFSRTLVNSLVAGNDFMKVSGKSTRVCAAAAATGAPARYEFDLCDDVLFGPRDANGTIFAHLQYSVVEGSGTSHFANASGCAISIAARDGDGGGTAYVEADQSAEVFSK